MSSLDDPAVIHSDADDDEPEDNGWESDFEWSLRDHLSNVSSSSGPIIGRKCTFL